MDSVLPILFEMHSVGDLPHYVPMLFGMCCAEFRELSDTYCSKRLKREVWDVCFMSSGEQFLGEYLHANSCLGRITIPYFQFAINLDTRSIHGKVEGLGAKIIIEGLTDYGMAKRKVDYREIKLYTDPQFFIERDWWGVSQRTNLRKVPGIGLLVLQYLELELPPQIIASLLKANMEDVRQSLESKEQFESWLMSFVSNPEQAQESYLRSDALTKEDKLRRWLTDNFCIDLGCKKGRVERIGHPRT